MHSCETDLCKTLNDIYLSSDNGKCTILISLDLSAAFDTIDHTSLLNRLSTNLASLVYHWHGSLHIYQVELIPSALAIPSHL